MQDIVCFSSKIEVVICFSLIDHLWAYSVIKLGSLGQSHVNRSTETSGQRHVSACQHVLH